MTQIIISFLENGLDVGMFIFCCALILVNLLFGGAIVGFFWCICIVHPCSTGVHSSCKDHVLLLLLALICFSIGLEIFDMELSSKLENGAVIVNELWNLAFSIVIFEASAYMLVREFKTLRGKSRKRKL